MDEEDCKTMAEYEADLEKTEEEEEDQEKMQGYEADCGRRQGRNVYIMYHGTTLQNAHRIMKHGFIPSHNGLLGRGVYVSRSFEKASHYPVNAWNQQRAVLRVSVRVGKVKKIDYQGHPLQKTWHAYGYNTAWVPPKCGMVRSGLEEDCVYNPTRIKVLDMIPN